MKKSFEFEIMAILAIISFFIGIRVHGAIANCDKQVCPYTTPAPSPTPEPTPSPGNGGQDDEQDTEVAFIYTA